MCCWKHQPAAKTELYRRSFSTPAGLLEAAPCARLYYSYALIIFPAPADIFEADAWPIMPAAVHRKNHNEKFPLS